MSTADLTNPHLTARRTFNDRYLSLAKGKWNLWVTVSMLLAAVISLVICVIYLVTKQQITPYIVTLDGEGRPKVVTELQATDVYNPHVIGGQLAAWIVEIRQLSTDAKVLSDNTEHAFAMSLGPAQNYVRGYYKDVPSVETLKRGPVYPSNVIVEQRDDKTIKSWHAIWDEEQQDLDGHRIGVKRWEAFIEIVLSLPTNRAEREAAPLGVWVERISWNERT